MLTILAMLTKLKNKKLQFFWAKKNTCHNVDNIDDVGYPEEKNVYVMLTLLNLKKTKNKIEEKNLPALMLTILTMRCRCVIGDVDDIGHVGNVFKKKNCIFFGPKK